MIDRMIYFILKFSNYCKYILTTLYSKENLPNRRSGVGGDAEAEDQSQEERRRLGDASQFNVRIVIVQIHEVCYDVYVFVSDPPKHFLRSFSSINSSIIQYN